MKISTRTRYALRFLVRLALTRPERPLPLGQAARRERISPKYLSRLVIPLRGAGLVESSAGPKGGYRLARPPDRITVTSVLKLFERGSGLVPCLGAGDDCRLAPRCRTRRFWRSLDRDIARRLARTTIEDIANGMV